MTQKFLVILYRFSNPKTVREVLIDRNHAGSSKARSAQVLRKRNSSGKASSDAGPELAGRESCVAMESPQALMCPLENLKRGLTSRHQTTGRVRVFATANTWRTQRPRGASGFGTESQ